MAENIRQAVTQLGAGWAGQRVSSETAVRCAYIGEGWVVVLSSLPAGPSEIWGLPRAAGRETAGARTSSAG